MEMSKSIVGERVENLFLENVASKILELLEMTEAQKRNYERRMQFCENTRSYVLWSGYRHAFDNYQKIWNMTMKVFTAIESESLS